MGNDTPSTDWFPGDSPPGGSTGDGIARAAEGAAAYDMRSLINFGVENEAMSAMFHQCAIYLALNDPDPVLVAMATAVSVVDDDADPLWLMIVGPSSGSKTETIRMVGGHVDEAVSDITLAGLFSQRPGSKRNPNPPPSGLLARLGDDCNAFVTISDMSSLLSRGGDKMSGSQTGGIFDALREVYDGAYSRSMDRVSPEWHGRVTFLAAVTPAIDSMRTHAEALGPRWLYFRMAQRDLEQRKEMARMVIDRGDLKASRAQVAETAGKLIELGRARMRLDVTASKPVMDLVEGCANLATYGRATVPRDYQGRIDDVPHWEEPGRLAGQLMQLARSLTALDIGEAAVRRITRRAALSCIPSARLAVLNRLAELRGDDWVSTHAASVDVALHYRVVKRALEDMEAVHILEERRKPGRALHHLVPSTENEPGTTHDRTPREWRIAKEYRELVA